MIGLGGLVLLRISLLTVDGFHGRKLKSLKSNHLDASNCTRHDLVTNERSLKEATLERVEHQYISTVILRMSDD